MQSEPKNEPVENDGEEVLRRRAANEAYASAPHEHKLESEEPEAAAEGESPAEDGQPELDVEALVAENAELKEKLLRALADADNARKRADRDREDIGKYAVSSFARDMVEVAENLMRASSSISAEDRAAIQQLETIAQGVDMTLQQLLGVFSKHGIKRIEPAAGEKFDHNYHQAIAQIEQNGIEPGAIVQVVQAGYVINDRLLRPAMVAVAKAPPAPVDATA